MTTSAPRSTPGPIKLYVVEDQAKVLRNQLKLLAGVGDIEILGAALSGETALEELNRLRPDVILLDLGLPGMSGLDVTRHVKAAWPQIEILILTVFDEEERVLAAVKAGASGYLLKGSGVEKLVEAIKEVHAGGAVIQPSLARGLLKRFLADRRPEELPGQARDLSAKRRLSPRETEILQLIVKGVSNAEAAKILSISKATIRTHLEHIYQKLEVTNRVEAVAEGIRQGLVNL